MEGINNIGKHVIHRRNFMREDLTVGHFAGS